MPSDQAKIEQAFALIRAELERARAKHGMVMASPHEGNSIIREEYEELWEHVRANTGRTIEAGEEATQIAAMAVKYMINFDPRVNDGTV
jgi:hypothetical protein